MRVYRDRSSVKAYTGGVGEGLCGGGQGESINGQCQSEDLLQEGEGIWVQ